MAARRARVIHDHRAPDRVPIQVRAGDRVMLGQRDRDWPQFVWTIGSNGLGGWVPINLFDCEQGPATALRDYDTVELDCNAGDELTVVQELAEWWWARNASGSAGWVPARNLELL